MNTKSKGLRIQRKAIAYLQEQGWDVGKVERSNRFETPKDLWGMFDLCCKKQGHILFVQVTTNKWHTHTPYIKFIREYGNEFISAWQIVYKDRVKEPMIRKY